MTTELKFTAFRIKHPDIEPEEATKILIEAKKRNVDLEDEYQKRLKDYVL